MNKSVLAGVIGGIAVATAVGSFALLGSDPEAEDAMAEAADVAAETEVAAEASTLVSQTQPTSQQAVTQTAVVEEVCWDEVVEVPAEPRDDKAIAGTATGAVIGGALAKKLGDDNDLLTAAGAAAGAFAGRRAQREYQENRTETRVERRCGPPGSQP